jgi:hypothetical protein
VTTGASGPATGGDGGTITGAIGAGGGGIVAQPESDRTAIVDAAVRSLLFIAAV